MGAFLLKDLAMSHFLRGSMQPPSAPRFALGRVVATPGAVELLKLTETSPFVLLARHVVGDWGECDPEDARTNDQAVVAGLRVMSVYRLPLMDRKGQAAAAVAPGCVDDDRLWVITEADRSVTTLLLPEEY